MISASVADTVANATEPVILSTWSWLNWHRQQIASVLNFSGGVSCYCLLDLLSKSHLSGAYLVAGYPRGNNTNFNDSGWCASKDGGCSIIRICYPICPAGGLELSYVVVGLGVFSMVYGAFALAQTDFKRVVAYSSVVIWDMLSLIRVWTMLGNGDYWKMRSPVRCTR